MRSHIRRCADLEQKVEQTSDVLDSVDVAPHRVSRHRRHGSSLDGALVQSQCQRHLSLRNRLGGGRSGHGEGGHAGKMGFQRGYLVESKVLYARETLVAYS